MAKPSPTSASLSPRLLVLELWGLGDLALAMPFLRAASNSYRVTLVAKPHAAPLLARFAPDVQRLPLYAPWTAFRRKYRLHQWPWSHLRFLLFSELRRPRFDLAVSARPDPRDHLFMALAGARRRLGFPRRGSGLFLTQRVAPPASPHRGAHWRALADALGLALPAPTLAVPTPHGRRAVIHTGAGHPVRLWPRERFEIIATRLRAKGWEVEFIETESGDLEHLITQLSHADRFIGNDSGPGHLAALLGVPTFTIFGPQLPELFAPQHPQAAWIEGKPCPYKPCFDACRFPEPFCIRELSTEEVWSRLQAWLDRLGK